MFPPQVKGILVLLWLALVAGPPLGADVRDEAEEPFQREAVRLINTVRDEDYAAFISQGTEEHRATSKASFQQATRQFSARLKHGYDLTYLADLKKGNDMDHIWKLTPKDGSDDIIVRLIMRAGLVHCFIVF
jgi:hypothetical protein